MAAVLKGADAFVFCGGIGEHAWQVREAVLKAWSGSASISTLSEPRQCPGHHAKSSPTWSS